MQRRSFSQVKSDRALDFGTRRSQRFKCLKCDSTHAAPVRNCPWCAPVEAEFLLPQRRLPVENKVKNNIRLKKVSKCRNSWKVRATADGVENIKTLLDLGSLPSHISGLVNILSPKTFLRMEELKPPLKISNVGTTPLWVKRKELLNCVEFITRGGPFIWRNLEALVNE